MELQTVRRGPGFDALILIGLQLYCLAVLVLLLVSNSSIGPVAYGSCNSYMVGFFLAVTEILLLGWLYTFVVWLWDHLVCRWCAPSFCVSRLPF
jgi:hypothetical protein